MAPTDPTLEFEHSFASEYRYIIACDEVGRGALAGPVAVGAAVVATHEINIPLGLRDSKLLSEKKRAAIVDEVSAWCIASAVGFAEADEIDREGISAMLGAAGRRALLELHEAGIDVTSALVLVDGSFDWLSPALQRPLRVITRVKADRDCASVAAASVIAKVRRDERMRELHERHPEYGWSSNKGYGAASHFEAISAHGVTQWHRKTWIRPEFVSGNSSA